MVIASAVHVSLVRDAHDAHQNPVDVDRVDDAVLTPTRLPVARNRQAKRLAYPVRILGERAVQEADYGEGDGLGKVPFDRALGARGKNNLVPGLAHARRSANAARTCSSLNALPSAICCSASRISATADLSERISRVSISDS